MLHLGIFAESDTSVVHVRIQLIFGNIKGRGVDIYPFEIYQVGCQLK